MLGALLLAAWFGQTVIVVLLGLLLAAAGLSRLWSRLSLVNVRCQRQLSQQRAFPGDSIDLKLRVINRKPLPLPWVQVEDEIPLDLMPQAAAAPGKSPGTGLLSHASALLWYTGVSWKQKLACKKRGYYALGPVAITSGDIFGFYSRSVTEPLTDHVVVYPRIYPVSRLAIAALQPQGDITAERRLLEDPTRLVGVRDYTPHDSLRHVHWKATARHQTLQVKVFEPTTTLKTEIFLAVDSFNHTADDDEDFELGISAAASIAHHVSEQRSPVGLMANTRLADSGKPVEILPGTGTAQLISILEALARATAYSSRPFEEFLQQERAALPFGTSLVFVAAGLTPALIDRLEDLKAGGHRLVVLLANKPAGDGRPEWHSIRDFIDTGAGVLR